MLIPDFQGEERLVRKIIDADPDVIAHNVETVSRLQYPVRDRRAGYEQSLSVLAQVERESDTYTKTSIMLGHGEYDHEVYQTQRTVASAASTSSRSVSTCVPREVTSRFSGTTTRTSTRRGVRSPKRS